MTHIESSMVVARSIKDTFDFLNEAEHHAIFIPNMIQFSQTSAGSFGQVGTKVTGILRILGMSFQVPYELTEHEQDHRLSMKGSLGSILFEDGYILEALVDATRIHFWLDIKFKGISKVFIPFASLIGRIHARETLRNLYRALQKNGR